MASPRQPRRPARAGARLVLSALVAFAVVGCGVSDSAGSEGGGSTDGFDPATTEVSVTFGAASIPDPRSYVLTVEDQQAHVVVESGRGVVHDETVAIPDDVWDPFVTGLEEDLGRVGDTERVDGGCTGGTTFRVQITSGDSDFVRNVDHCGSDRNEEVVERLEATLAPIFEVVDLETLLERD